MELHFMMLAPYAEIIPDGKVSMISGDIDKLTILGGDFPAISSTPLYLIGKLILAPEDCGRGHHSRAEVVDPNGTVVAVNDGSFDVPPHQPGVLAKMSFTVILQGFALPVPGPYVVRLLIDGKEIKRLPLSVEKPLPA